MQNGFNPEFSEMRGAACHSSLLQIKLETYLGTISVSSQTGIIMYRCNKMARLKDIIFEEKKNILILKSENSFTFIQANTFQQTFPFPYTSVIFAFTLTLLFSHLSYLKPFRPRKPVAAGFLQDVRKVFAPSFLLTCRRELNQCTVI